MSFYKQLIVVFSLFVLSGPVSADGYEQGGDPAIRDVSAVPPVAVRAGGPSIMQAQGEELSRAVAHYARARALIISAIEEFDRAYKVAKPDVVLDSKGFRRGLVERAEDLERLLAPQARISKTGVRLEGDNRLLKVAPK